MLLLHHSLHLLPAVIVLVVIIIVIIVIVIVIHFDLGLFVVKIIHYIVHAFIIVVNIMLLCPALLPTAKLALVNYFIITVVVLLIT